MPLAEPTGLVDPLLVEGDPWRPARQRAAGVGVGPTVADEQDRGHGAHSRCPLVRGRAVVVTMWRDHGPGRLPWRGSVRLRRPERRAGEAADAARRVHLDRAQGPDRRGVRHRQRRAGAAPARGRGRGQGQPAGQDRAVRGQHPRGAEDACAICEETSDVETGEVMVFVGDRFVVTVRRGEGNPLRDVRHRLELNRDQLALGPAAVLHAVMDSVVDNYVLIERALSDDMERIEQQVFTGAEDTDVTAIYRLKREVLEFRRAAYPLAEALGRVGLRPVPGADRQRGAAVLPRRGRPPGPGQRPHRVLRPAAHRHPQRPPHPGHGPAERGHAAHLRVGRDGCGADVARGHLRDELPVHARAHGEHRCRGSRVLLGLLPRAGRHAW